MTSDSSRTAQWSLNPNVGVAFYESDASRLYAAGLFAATLNYNPSKHLNFFIDTGLQSPETRYGRNAVIVDFGMRISSAATSSSTSVLGHGSQVKRRRGCFCRPASASGSDQRERHGALTCGDKLIAASAPSLAMS